MSIADQSGHVSGGGPSWVLDLGVAVVRKCSVGHMDNNAYLVTCTRTGARLLIDAADDAPRLLELLSEDAALALPDTDLSTVFTTHRHQDHHKALSAIVEATGATTAAGEADADELPVRVQVRLQHGDSVQVGDVTLDVIALRGHTPGSVALALNTPEASINTTLFTGDSLFPGGPGKTWSAPDFESLIGDLESRVFGVYDDALVLPGHGDNTTLNAEREQLPRWRERGW